MSLFILIFLLQDPKAFEEAKTLAKSAVEKRKAGDPDGAIADLTRAIELSPRFAYAWTELGYLKNEKGDYKGALSDLNRSLEINPKQPEAFNNRAFAKQNLGDHVAAIKDFTEAIVLNPRLAAAYDGRASSKREKGDLDGALADHDKAVDLSPKNVPSLNNRGKTKRAKGDYAGAIADHTRALEIDPEDPIVLQGRGRAYLLSGSLEKAIADLRKGVDLDGSAVGLRFDHGSALFQARRFREAAAEFATCCKLDPDGQDDYRLRLWLCRARGGEEKEAADDLRQYFKKREEPADWIRKIAAFLLDECSEKELLAAVADPKKPSRRVASANYYAATRRLLRKDDQGAAELFQACVEAGFRDSYMTLSAKLELAALKGK